MGSMADPVEAMQMLVEHCEFHAKECRAAAVREQQQAEVWDAAGREAQRTLDRYLEFNPQARKPTVAAVFDHIEAIVEDCPADDGSMVLHKLNETFGRGQK